MRSKIDRTIDEFCNIGKLESFRTSVSQLFKHIEASGCTISSRQDEKRSSHEFNNKKCIMRICLLDIYNEPIEIIWTILHEFGHHITGKPSEKQIDFSSKLDRERIAWQEGRLIALNFPAFTERIYDFDKYANHCLQTYITATKNGS
jgi:hypothetical protein